MCAWALIWLFIAGMGQVSAMYQHDNRRWYEQSERIEQEVPTVASVVHDYFNLNRPNLGQVLLQQPVATNQLVRNHSHDRLLLDEMGRHNWDMIPVRPPTPSLIAAGGSTLSRSKADLPFYE